MADEKTKVGDPSEKADAGKVKKKISLVKILVLVLIIVLVVIGGALGYLYLRYHLASADTGSGTKTQASGPGETDSSQGTEASEELNTYELKPFIVNLADDGSYLKITVALGYGAAEQQQLLESKSTQMRDAILSILSSNSTKTLSTKHGKIKLKEDIKTSLGNIAGLKNIITSVYFTDFQIL